MGVSKPLPKQLWEAKKVRGHTLGTRRLLRGSVAASAAFWSPNIKRTTRQE